MSTQEALEQVLRSYQVYYDVHRENTDPPFAAEAEFSLHDEQYFLIKSARISEADTKEFVYFATVDQLDAQTLRELDACAWERGLQKVTPHKDHRNSDIVLILLADHIDPEAGKLVPKLSHYKSYKWGFQGWSHYRLVAIELSSGRAVTNRQGRDLKKLVSNITF